MILRTCPQCSSTDIVLDRLMGITGNRYKCNTIPPAAECAIGHCPICTCGYSGELIVEQDVEKKFRK